MHDPESELLEISWAHAVTLFIDLTREDALGPIGDEERAIILGLTPCCEDCEPIDVYIPGSVRARSACSTRMRFALHAGESNGGRRSRYSTP